MTRIDPTNCSEFLKHAVALDGYFQEIERLSIAILRSKPETEKGLERSKKLLVDFDETRRGLAQQMSALGGSLESSHAQIAEMTEKVSEFAGIVVARQKVAESLVERLRELSKKVGKVTEDASALNQTEQTNEATNLSGNVLFLIPQIQELIDEVKELRNDAKIEKLDTLERTSDSLFQKLVSMNNRLKSLVPTSDAGANSYLN